MIKRLTIDQIISIRRDNVIFTANGDNSLYLLSLSDIEDCKWDDDDFNFNYELKQGTTILGKVRKIKSADADYYVKFLDFPWGVD